MVCLLRAGDFGHWMLTFSHIGERSCKYDIKFLLTYNIRRNPFFNYEKHKLQKKNTLYTYSYNPIIHSWLEYGKHFQKRVWGYRTKTIFTALFFLFLAHCVLYPPGTFTSNITYLPCFSKRCNRTEPPLEIFLKVRSSDSGSSFDSIGFGLGEKN